MKFGTFKGVFVPSTEAILGTVLFLILPALVGDLGLILMTGIIILAHSVTLATSSIGIDLTLEMVLTVFSTKAGSFLCPLNGER